MQMDLKEDGKLCMAKRVNGEVVFSKTVPVDLFFLPEEGGVRDITLQWGEGSMQDGQTKFEGFAVVELMGHQREIGYVTTEAFGQAVMFRIDTPELPEREFELKQPTYVEGEYRDVGTRVKRAATPAKTRLVSPAALYAINPCTEEVARLEIDRYYPRPLILVELPKVKAIEGPQEETIQDLLHEQEDPIDY